MIIDAHGHYTTVPSGHRDFRKRQLAWLSDPSGPRPAEGTIGDDEIRESIENNQLKSLRERGEDLMVISPQASAMEHHVPDPLIAATAISALTHALAPASSSVASWSNSLPARTRIQGRISSGWRRPSP